MLVSKKSITGKRNPPVFVGVIYRPSKIAFLKNVDLINSLPTMSGNYSHKIIMGDRNADLLCGRHDARRVRNLAAELSLQLIQHGPTHINPASRTWIDMIFVYDNDNIINDRNIPANFHSKHNSIDVTIKLRTTVTKITTALMSLSNSVQLLRKALHLLIETIRKSCQKSSPRNYLDVIGHSFH